MDAAEASRRLLGADVDRTRELGTDPPQTSRRPPARPRNRLAETGFALEGPLGRGGQGEVFRARQRALRRTIADKVLRRDLPRPEEAEAAFLAEAVTTGQLEHPNIVPVYQLGERDGELFLAMKMLGGQSWKVLREERSDLNAAPRSWSSGCWSTRCWSRSVSRWTRTRPPGTTPRPACGTWMSCPSVPAKSASCTPARCWPCTRSGPTRP